MNCLHYIYYKFRRDFMTTEETEVIKENMGFIYKIASHFYGTEKEDLVQEGIMAMINAYRSFKDDGEAKFTSYAFKPIFGAMYKLATQKQIKMSQEYLKLYRSIETARYSLAQKWGYIPTNEEIALFLEKDVAIIEQAIVAGSIIVSSLDKASEEDRSVYETIAFEESISWDDRLTLQEGLEQLNEEERKIIEYRYFKDMTQSEVARVLKKNQVMVSRYEKKGIDKIRNFYAA